jgi:patatin-like phospholipase/acyl hydrolase
MAFKILSLDGGGIRGAFSAGFLAELEQQLGCRIADYFDLIAGTSTGAIIAAALATGEPASRIESFYRDDGPKIFARRGPKWWRLCRHAFAACANQILSRYSIDFEWLIHSKYDGELLRESLSGVFAEKQIGDIALTRVIIPAFDMTRGQTIVFKTPHLPGMYRDRHYKIVDVLMATTAAPSYFPHGTIGAGSAYIDGGIWVNNPSMAAVAESIKIRNDARRPDFDRPFEIDDIQLLTIGTGKAPYFAVPPNRAGLFWWGPHLLNVTSLAQSQGVNFQAQYVLGQHMIRIDYELPNGTWTLDNLQVLDQMTRIGRERCTENLTAVREMFFRSKAAHKYTPFEPD